MAEKSMLSTVARIAAVLTLICTLVAALLSFVYSATNDQYEQNMLNAKREAIASLFDREIITTEELPTDDFEVEELYRVSEGGVLIGFCANVKSAGFGGNIDMMVAVDPSGAMLGVKIVSMSETPGLGSRVGEEEHLEQYRGDFWYGYDGGLTLGEDIDAISGATISSKAVNEGVNRALDALLNAVKGEE